MTMQQAKTSAAPRGRRGNRIRQGRAFGLYAVLGYLVLAFVLLISIAPLIWVLLSSFKTNNEILESAFTLPKTP